MANLAVERAKKPIDTGLVKLMAKMQGIELSDAEAEKVIERIEEPAPKPVADNRPVGSLTRRERVLRDL